MFGGCVYEIETWGTFTTYKQTFAQKMQQRKKKVIDFKRRHGQLIKYLLLLHEQSPVSENN